MKATIKKHKKKVAAGASLVAILTALLATWSNVYPAICPLLPGQYRCMAVGQAVRAIDHSLDTKQPILDSTVLDSDAGLP